MVLLHYEKKKNSYITLIRSDDNGVEMIGNLLNLASGKRHTSDIIQSVSDIKIYMNQLEIYRYLDELNKFCNGITRLKLPNLYVSNYNAHRGADICSVLAVNKTLVYAEKQIRNGVISQIYKPLVPMNLYITYDDAEGRYQIRGKHTNDAYWIEYILSKMEFLFSQGKKMKVSEYKKEYEKRYVLNENDEKIGMLFDLLEDDISGNMQISVLEKYIEKSEAIGA